MKDQTRRQFVKTTTTAAAISGLSLWGTKQSWAGANDRVNVAVVGIRAHGFGSHIKSYAKLENVRVAALCDVDSNLYPERVKWLVDSGYNKPKTYQDIRKLLENKDIDAISVATPNHWHTLAGVWALQAGKHAHIEKPFSHNIFEGQQLIKAAKKYNHIVHHGTESRSSNSCQEGVKLLREGIIGEVYMAKGTCYKWRNGLGTYPDGYMAEGEGVRRTLGADPQAGYSEEYMKKVDYDMWTGPAPKRPFNPHRFHYNWHWNYDYGNGDIGNQGIHEMDVARWGLGVDSPSKIMSMGGHFMWDDAQNTANTQIAVFEFPSEEGGGDKKKILQFEVRHWITNNEAGLASGFEDDTATGYMSSGANVIGDIFYGSEGFMTMTSGHFKTFLGKKREPGPSMQATNNTNMDHYNLFINAVRANDPKLLDGKGSPMDGHLSCSLMHMANTSYRLGRSLDWDAKTEKFVNDDEANKMIKRDYRAPFVVPEIA
jgi:predicted dehydrogenase